MAFAINEFISSMTNDGFRPNLFEIIFDGTGTGPQFTIRAKATSIPASTVGIAPAYYFGRQAKFAGNRVFSDWTVSVLVDEPDLVGVGPRASLERWSNAINLHNANIRDGGYVSPATYQMDAHVIQYGKNGNVISTYDMIRCFPISIGEIGLDWGDNDRIAEFPVTFALNWWQHAGTTDLG